MTTAVQARPEASVSIPPWLLPNTTCPSSTICPHCGGRLFREVDSSGRRPRFYMLCVNCAQEFDERGRVVRHSIGEHRVRVV